MFLTFCGLSSLCGYALREKMNAFGYAREREQFIENAREKCRNWRNELENQFKTSIFSRIWNFPNWNFPTSKETFHFRSVLSNFARFFPISIGSYQLRSVLSNFAWLFPTSAKLSYLRLSNLKLSNFRLSNSKFSNFSFFPTALSKYTYPVTYLDEAFDGKLLQYVTFFISFKIFK